MASAEGTVNIIVDIIGNFEEELKKLDTQLEKIDKKKISPDLDIDAEEEIKQIQAQLKQLEKNLDTILDIDVRGEGQAMATKALLSRDMHSTLHIDRDTSTGLPPPVEGALQASRSSAVRAAPDDSMMFRRSFNPLSFEGLIDPERVSPQQGLRNMGVPGDIGGIASARRRMFDGPDGSVFSGMGIRKLNQRVNASFRRMLQQINRLRPNMMQLWNVMAAAIPIIVTLGAAAIGLAAALGTVATAGVAILGLGLLGWGDSFSESIQNVQQEAMKLGRTLFSVLQPAADVAQPVLMEWMQGAPRQVQKIVGPLKELIQAFDAPLGRMGAGVMDWIADVIDAMTSMRGMIVQILSRFGRIAGEFLIEWLANMIEFAFENQEALIRMARAVRLLFRWLLKISMVVVAVLAAFSPLLEILDPLVDMITNKYVAGIITAIITSLALTTAVTSLAAALKGLTFAAVANKILSFLGTVWAAITGLRQLIVTLGALRGALVMTGIGLLSVLAGMAAMEAMEGPGTGGGGGPRGRRAAGGDIIIQGDVREREMDRLMDEVPRQAQSEDDIRNMRERP